MEILIVLLIVVGLVTLVGHGIWVLVAGTIKLFRNPPEAQQYATRIFSWHCEHCETNVGANSSFCKCGTPKPSDRLNRALRNLDITQSEIVRLHSEGKLDLETLATISQVLRAERSRLTSPVDSPVNTVTPEPEIERVVEHSYIPTQETISNPEPVVEEQREEPKPRVPRRSFSEVLNSFMEESNIRWGEIVGGLLIIGCSTALVVSLWSQISQIPVLKFLIFTTVTAVLFGIGLYTEHRWKLPTTSRGILTIATLLVPLNFLAIAAVSSSSTAGFLVLGSELLAPAIFLCLVYFAGRVITPGCAHLLAAGILGSSIGQLLVRHFGAPDASPELLIFLGAFPVVCYVIAVGFALRRVLSDRVIDETETSTVFTILGTMSFAALLPFGLLLYKSGPIGMTMMYLAPLVTLWGVPLLATGAVMWRRIQNVELVASRTAGTALGVLGLMIVLAGMILAWPNPASVVPTAILNFIIFTGLALALELPVAHLFASGCLALGYLVTFHVVTGHIRWQNLRVESLVDVSLQMSSGNALAAAFVLLLVASDWLRHKLHLRESFYYLIAACSIGIISIATITVFGPLGIDNKQTVWLFYLIFSLGGFWIAFRRQLTGFAWIGAALLLFSCASEFAWTSEHSFPWQTAFLFHSSVCAVAAILCSRAHFSESLCKVLNYSALVSVVLAVLSLFQTNPYQVTSMQATRVFWIAGIFLLSLWLNRKHVLFVSLQVALTAAVILSVKAALQQYEWYTYLPHAFLHPVGLQIQGTFLAILCLCWIASRFVVQRFVSGDEHSLKGIRELFDAKLSVDRIIPWILLLGFTLLSVYGALSGIAREFALRGTDYPGWNIANFPHQEAFAIGSWIVMGLLAVIMLANAWERRSHVYLIGVVVAVAGVIPLLAARLESQLATATAWRFLAVGFFLVGSVLLWGRERLSVQLKSFRWPSFSEPPEVIARNLRMLLISLTVAPVVIFTLYPALRAMAHVPVQLPVSGVFSFFDPDFLFVVPLVVIAVVLIGYGIRERAPLYWFCAGLFFNFTVTLAHVLSVVVVDAPLDSVVLVRTVQLNAITFAVCSLVWLSFRSRSLALLGVRATAADNLLKLQTQLAALLNIALLLPLALEVFSGKGNQTIQAAGSLIGWLALSLSLAGFVLVKQSKGESFSAGTLATALMSVVCLITFGVTDKSDALDLRILTAGTTVVAWLMFATASLPGSLKNVRLNESWSRHCLRLAPVIGSVAAFLGVRLLGAVQRPDWWWSAMPLLALSALAGALNYRTLRRRHIFAAGLLFSLAVWILCLRGQSIRSLMVLFEVSIMAACLFAAVSVWLHNRSQKLSEQRWRLHRLSYHNVVVVGSVFILTVLTLVRFLFGSELIHLIQHPALTWMAWLSIIALMFASLWDRKGMPTVGFYALGLIGVAIGLQQLNLTGDDLAWAALIILATYSIGVSLLWRKRSMLFAVAESLGIPFRIEPTTTHMNWLSAATMLAVLSIGLTAFWINLAFLSLGFRVSAALALVAQTITLGLLAEGVSRERWQRASISALMIGAVLAGWSWLTPHVNATWLNRSVILMVLAFSLTAVFGIFLRNLVKRTSLECGASVTAFVAFSPNPDFDKAVTEAPHSKEVRWSTWGNSIRACLPSLLSAGLVALLFCLCTEVFYQLSFGEVRVHPVSLVAIGATLISGVIISVLFALSPNVDPRLSSEQARIRLVYVAEVMLVLLFLHVRLAMPWLFTGFFEDYWPLVVMSIAYLGVIASESLRRRDLLVLAKPLERTGVFLPLLPVLGFWFATSNVDYSSLLFVVGGLYGLLSILRRSFIFGALAAVAGNAGFWHLLQRTDDYGFMQHPQVWLIPTAASVLIAAYLNEDRLKEDEMASLRYLSLVTIYASSTADIFINGVENSPWLPLVLGALSLAGVLSGIMFRIRGLLLLGSVFLLLSITTMIWYASANLGWTWLWYVAGIATGATIIFMFAVFEKKRNEVLQVVEGLKDWEI